MSLIHTRAVPDAPLPCLLCGAAVGDPGGGLLVLCVPCTRRLRAALHRERGRARPPVVFPVNRSYRRRCGDAV